MPNEPMPRDQILTRAVDQWKDQVQGRVVVVTGGARGLGRSVVEVLATAGAKVVALDRTWVGSEAFASDVEKSGGLALTADITSGGDLDAALDRVVDTFGTVDVLVNNAALVTETQFPPLGHRPVLDTNDDDWATTFSVNLFGTVKVTQRFIEPMRTQGSGSIINVVSSGILTYSNGGGWYSARPYTAEAIYQAAKAALTTYGFYLAEEARGDGVAVNSVMPGHSRTSWFDDTANAVNDTGGVYFLRPVVPEHMLPITLFLSAQTASGASGRLYYAPDWNYDHGFGDYALWQDHGLPEAVEKMYSTAEALMPPFSRSGISGPNFDTQTAMFVAALTRGGDAKE